MQEKMRVYVLAKQLNVESKQLLDYCKELGFEAVKNQLSGLEPAQVESLTERLKRGSKPAAPAPVAPVPTVLPQNIGTRVQTLPSRRAPAQSKTAEPTSPAHVEAESARSQSPAPVDEVPSKASEAPATPAAETAAPPVPTPATPAAPATPTKAPATPVAPAATSTPPPARPSTLPPRPTPAPGVAAQAPGTTKLPPRPSPAPPSQMPGDNRVRNIGSGPRPDGGAGSRRVGPRLNVRPRPNPAQNYAPRASTTSLRHPQPGTTTPPAGTPMTAPTKKEVGGVRKLANLTTEMIGKGRNITAEQVMQAHHAQNLAPVTGAPETGAIDDDETRDKDGKKKPGAVQGRDQRRAARDDRARARKDSGVQVTGGRVTVVDDDRPLRVRDRLKKRPHVRQPGTAPRKGKVQIDEPITVRALSVAVGLTVPKLLKKLEGLGLPFGTVSINSVLETDMAELIAQDQGCELEIRREHDAEGILEASHQEVDDPTKLQTRPPIVAVMGHVDHGKTSLLDRIRRSNVAGGEVGGITQVIRAWQVEHDGHLITFLDTPGHEAFTKMRARGAQVTDIAVIVVAADDGVMPQTEEAIAHAKAAGVSIVVAINKVDLPNANINKTRQQLYGLDVLPDDMGGDVPFVETSAAKDGKGIDKLLEAILLVAELKELKANAEKPGRGTVLEAHLSGDEGVVATLLIKDGTLKKGDVIVCGAAHGRVRALYSDLGNPIESAGPSTPVRLTGLDEVPEADDPFAVVGEISTAREIAEKRQGRRQKAAHIPLSVQTLESLGATKVSELKVILKADFRGSIEAIKKELEKLRHDEVRVRVLHAAIGGITASDVQLAMTSPADSMIVGFNAVPDDEARTLAEQNGIPIREYSIIYNLTDDIKAALEGKLKPREEIVYLGRAVVREVFKISKVGTVAGSHVTSGTIERSAKVRLIRDGVVVYPPSERTVGLESLKRHKDDVREVSQGYDCGIKIAGYDDIKVNDVIEAYRVEEIKRTL